MISISTIWHRKLVRPSAALLLALSGLVSSSANATTLETGPSPLLAAPDPFASGPVAAGGPREPALIPPPSPDPRLAQADAVAERAKFSGARLVVEVLAGATVGGLAAYSMYAGLCNPNDNCVLAAWGGAATELVVTPLVVSSVGGWMGGQGSFWASFLLSVPALIPMTIPNAPDADFAQMSSHARTGLIIMTSLTPLFSAAGYELMSHIRARQTLRTNEWQRSAPVTVGFVPLQGPGGLTGGLSSFSFRF
jgi:hypothetical protein